MADNPVWYAPPAYKDTHPEAQTPPPAQPPDASAGMGDPDAQLKPGSLGTLGGAGMGFANMLLFNQPEAIANDTKQGLFGQAIRATPIGGLAQALVDALGKKNSARFIAEPSIANMLGKTAGMAAPIIGGAIAAPFTGGASLGAAAEDLAPIGEAASSVGSKFLSLLNKPNAALAARPVLGGALTGAGEQVARSSALGDTDTMKNVGIGGAFGAAGGLIGKGLQGIGTRAAINPEETMARAADRTDLNAVKNLYGVTKQIDRKVFGSLSPEEQLRFGRDQAAYIRKNNIVSTGDMMRDIAGVNDNWQAAAKAFDDHGIRITDFKNHIDSLPEVRKLAPQQKTEFDAIINDAGNSNAAGLDQAGIEAKVAEQFGGLEQLARMKERMSPEDYQKFVQPLYDQFSSEAAAAAGNKNPSLYQTRGTLENMIVRYYKAASPEATAVGVKDQLANENMADALKAARETYFNKGLRKAFPDNPDMAKNLLESWRLSRLAREALNRKGLLAGQIVESGSQTAFAQALGDLAVGKGSMQQLVGSIIGKPVQGAINTGLNKLAGAQMLGASPLMRQAAPAYAKAMTAMDKLFPPGVAGRTAAGFIGRGGGNMIQHPEQGEDQAQTTGFDMTDMEAPATEGMAAPDTGQAVMPMPQELDGTGGMQQELTEQAAQIGKQLQSQVGGSAPQGYSPYASAVQSGATPHTMAAVAMQAATGAPKAANAFSQALEKGIYRLYNRLYMGYLGPPTQGNPGGYQYYQELRRGVMDGLTRPDGSIDYIQAGKILYPNNEFQQKQYADAMGWQMKINNNLGPAMNTAGVGAPSFLSGIMRALGGSKETVPYTALRDSIAAMAGDRSGGAVQEFDNIMGDYRTSTQEKKAKIQGLLDQYQHTGAGLMQAAGMPMDIGERK